MKYLSQRQKEANASNMLEATPPNPTSRVRIAHISRIAPPRIEVYPGRSHRTSDDASNSEPPPSYDSLFSTDNNKPRY